MITYNWMFFALYCDTEKSGQEDVVYEVGWIYEGVDADGYSAQVRGTVNCDYEAGDPFIAFADLQLSDVEGWVTTILGVDEIAALAADIDIQIANAIAPKQVVIYEMPWAEAAAAEAAAAAAG